MTATLRVVLVEPTLHDNGAIRVSLDRAKRWQRSGADVVVFVVEHAAAAEMVSVPEGMDIRFATRVPRRFRWTALVGALKLLRLARRADVVVAGREVHSGLLLASVVARLARRPLAVTVQSRPDIALDEHVSDALRVRTRRALVSADMAVCVAAGLVPVLSGLGLPVDRARVVTNGVNVQQIRDSAMWSPLVDLPAGTFVVASGRLHRQKGFDILLRAHALALHGDGLPHTLVLIGEGPDRTALERLAHELNVESSVVFTGFTENPHAVVARAAAFVLPSRWEGYPLALVEALCCGTPVIAADCVSGPAEVLDGDRFGALVPVEDPGALAAALVGFLRDGDELRQRATAGAGAALRRFDPDVAAQAHLGLLRELSRSTSLRSRRQRFFGRSAQAERSASPATDRP